MNTNIDEHPYEPNISDESTKLIIGTMPPPRFCSKPKKLYPSDVDFYYGSRDNHFWDIVSEVFNTSLTRGTSTAITEREKLLHNNKIGICDILVKSKREKIDSASDNNIIIDDESYFLDIEDLLNKYPNIKILIYTSQIVKSFIYKKTKKEHRKINNEMEIKLNDTSYKVIILPSPSHRNTTEYSEKIKSYQKALMK